MTEPTMPKAFSTAELEALVVVLDSIVPASDDGQMPSAAALGIEPSIERALDATPELKGLIAETLAALTAAAAGCDPRGWAGLSADRKAKLVDEAGLPPVLVLQAYAAYYQHPLVLEVLGLDARPPHPEGYAMKENDFELLEPVRRRRPMYRVS